MKNPFQGLKLNSSFRTPSTISSFSYEKSLSGIETRLWDGRILPHLPSFSYEKSLSGIETIKQKSDRLLPNKKPAICNDW